VAEEAKKKSTDFLSNVSNKSGRKLFLGKMGEKEKMA